MGRACCVLGCPSGGDAPSHQIPKNPVFFQKWKNMIFSEKIQHLTDEQISKCAVCYRHFADDDYLVTFKVRKLKRGVIPSLNLPNKTVSNISSMIKMESQIHAISTNTFALEQVTESQKITEVPETMQIALFEDTPDIESCLHKQPEILPNKYTKQINSHTIKESYKFNYRKKQKNNTTFLSLLRWKQQAKQYEKTSTMQKLLSFLSPAEISCIKTKIRKSKYSPKVYVRIYHHIARKKAFD